VPLAAEESPSAVVKLWLLWMKKITLETPFLLLPLLLARQSLVPLAKDQQQQTQQRQRQKQQPYFDLARSVAITCQQQPTESTTTASPATPAPSIASLVPAPPPTKTAAKTLRASQINREMAIIVYLKLI